MRPGELRIGNYYLYKGLEIKFDISDFKEIDHNLLDLLKPIPLTKKRLIELGLKKDKQDTGDCFYSKGDFSIILYDNYVSYFDGDIEAKKYYVHELQNLFYSLCGKELVNETIKA